MNDNNIRDGRHWGVKLRIKNEELRVFFYSIFRLRPPSAIRILPVIYGAAAKKR
jgi:hypothetical protein